MDQGYIDTEWTDTGILTTGSSPIFKNEDITYEDMSRRLKEDCRQCHLHRCKCDFSQYMPHIYV